MNDRQDIYTTITHQLLKAIENGAGKWRMPWHHDGATIMRPASAAGRRYNGINRLVLWATADAAQYTSGTWGTFNQWKDKGGHVRKGEKGTHIILWKRFDSTPEHNSDTCEPPKGRAFAKGFVVFNRDQIEGLENETIVEIAPPDTDIATALHFLENLGIPVEYGPHDAHYQPCADKVFLPRREAFLSDKHLVATLGHEIVHATGHRTRLNRETLYKYNDQLSIRAREELCAEIGASFLMADLGLAYTPRQDHAQYLASWLTALQNDTKAIFAAASQAQNAAEWIHATFKAAHSSPVALAA